MFGVLWLLSELGFMPPINWLWTAGLAGTGILTMVVGGLNKQTLVIGPYLILCAGFSILRHTGNISMRLEIPCLIISFGVVLFIVTMLGYSLPDLINDE